MNVNDPLLSIMIYPYPICNWASGQKCPFVFATRQDPILILDVFPPQSSEVGDVWFKIHVRKTARGDGYMWQHLADTLHL